jgi:3-hydroxy-9,10-secoandrosta-1,3,5(10)-triene-9,17-dione monooxygenase
MTKLDGLGKPTAETLGAGARAMISAIAGHAAAARRGTARAGKNNPRYGSGRLLSHSSARSLGRLRNEPQVFYDVLIALAEADMSTGWVHGVVEHEFDIAIIHRHAQTYARRSPFLSMPD